MIRPYFDTRPCDISILGYMLSGLLYPRVCFRLYVVGFIVPTGLRVWVLEEQTRTRKPDGYEVYPVKKPAGIEFSLCPHPNWTKTHRVSGTRCHPYSCLLCYCNEHGSIIGHFEWFWWSSDNAINGTNVFIKCISSGPKNEIKSPRKAKHKEWTRRKIEMDEFRRN